MDTTQKTLYDELCGVVEESYRTSRRTVLNKNDFVPSGEGIIFPCVIARRLPLEMRPGHISTCDACKRIEKELDESVGIFQEHGAWY